MSTVPLPLVLLEYDRLWTDNVHGANTRSAIAFASLLRSLGLVKGSGWWGSLGHWLEQHAAVALALWIAMFEFYSRTRSMALEAGEDWAHKLSALELHGESPGWHAYLQQLGLERAGDGGRPPQLYPHRANFFLGNEVAVEPTFTDLYVALHDDKEALLGEAARCARSPPSPSSRSLALARRADPVPTSTRSEHVAQSSPHRVMARKVWCVRRSCPPLARRPPDVRSSSLARRGYVPDVFKPKSK